MLIKDFINIKYIDPIKLRDKYLFAKPFPHIVLDNFFNENILNSVLNEFPNRQNKTGDLYGDLTSFEFNKKRSRNGIGSLPPSTYQLVSLLNSDKFLIYLRTLTGIKEHLISDPYLSGGGFHETKNGGFLKIHVDFNKHLKLNLDRRINLLIYLNKNWNDDWGGKLELYDHNDMSKAALSVSPKFNNVVIFNTNSFSYHGHPDPLTCPEKETRKSLALYYFSSGRPKEEITGVHSTIFKNRDGEVFKYKFKLLIKKNLYDWVPPIVLRNIRKLLNFNK